MNTEAVVKKKPKSRFSNFRLFQTSLLYQTREFFNNSTLHGVRYIAETGRPFGERFENFVFIGMPALMVNSSLCQFRQIYVVLFYRHRNSGCINYNRLAMGKVSNESDHHRYCQFVFTCMANN